MKISGLLVPLSIFFLAFAAPPASLGRRADNSPGLGVELELRNLKYVNPNEELKPPPEGKCSPDEVSLVKGVPIKVLHTNPPGSSKNDWLLTAKHCGREDSTGISCVVSEFIVDGTKVKVGANRAKIIGDEILNFLVSERIFQLIPPMRLYTPNGQYCSTVPSNRDFSKHGSHPKTPRARCLSLTSSNAGHGTWSPLKISTISCWTSSLGSDSR